MTTTVETEHRAPDLKSAQGDAGRHQFLTIAAVASLSAGAVHAAAIGAHAEHPRAAEAFVAVALFQLAWGCVALVRRTRAVALVGLIGNVVFFGGWVLAKWKGLSFISGLDEVEPMQFADSAPPWLRCQRWPQRPLC